jgi:hypothetical protein
MRYRFRGPYKKAKTLEQRFWEKVWVGFDDQCWIWTGAVSGKMGSGKFWDGERQVEAHRFSFELFYGVELGQFQACHECDNPKCVNPYHLFAGTQQDNLLDMMRKGRRYQPDNSGEKNGRAILSKDLVEEARKKHMQGFSKSSLAREYGVSWTAMDLALKGETWK